MSNIRVMLVEYHRIVRAGLRLLVNGQPDMQVVAEADSAATALPLIGALNPDVILLDLTLPGGGGLELIESVSAGTPVPHVLVLTAQDDPAYARAALGAGAIGYIVKSAREEELIAAIRATHRGQVFVDLDDPARTANVIGALRPTGSGGHSELVAKLSGREVEVLRLLSKGFTNQAVAQQLELSPKTVATYKARIGDKLGLKTTADFVRYAVDLGLHGAQEQFR